MKKARLFVWFIAFGIGILSAQKNTSKLHLFETKFDINTVETVNGVIHTVETILTSDKDYCCIHLQLENNEDKVNIHVGPDWYLEEKRFELKRGDVLQVTGSRIIHERKELIIAMQIEKNGSILPLRDERGCPLWQECRKDSTPN
ncbi:hypothetical protein [Flagellimonas meridianipacifica]|uniref:Magnetosome protein MamS/MamX domain-containing protein n=1 Tax=Flagellimonas meridianipacifica TaxID=1080225 RepID=A0A2T0MIB1_9FLAO|nr:hypothetical protein [Allomuricauda pacifica]PRX57246.1 hypothetical protein CLV81_1249 [Allomuricauda pacifica]